MRGRRMAPPHNACRPRELEGPIRRVVHVLASVSLLDRCAPTIGARGDGPHVRGDDPLRSLCVPQLQPHGPRGAAPLPRGAAQGPRRGADSLYPSTVLRRHAYRIPRRAAESSAIRFSDMDASRTDCRCLARQRIDDKHMRHRWIRFALHVRDLKGASPIFASAEASQSARRLMRRRVPAAYPRLRLIAICTSIAHRRQNHQRDRTDDAGAVLLSRWPPNNIPNWATNEIAPASVAVMVIISVS